MYVYNYNNNFKKNLFIFSFVILYDYPDIRPRVPTYTEIHIKKKSFIFTIFHYNICMYNNGTHSKIVSSSLSPSHVQMSSVASSSAQVVRSLVRIRCRLFLAIVNPLTCRNSDADCRTTMAKIQSPQAMWKRIRN